jgi:hypothetical protein
VYDSQFQPLEWAVHPGRTACLRELLRVGARPRAAEDLACAAWYGYTECVRELLRAGSPLQSPGWSPLLQAARANRPAIVSTLALAGASTDALFAHLRDAPGPHAGPMLRVALRARFWRWATLYLMGWRWLSWTAERLCRPPDGRWFRRDLAPFQGASETGHARASL